MIVKGRTLPIIAGLGEVLWDVFVDGEKFGGAPANFACHSAGVGGEVFMISAVGDDLLGQLAIDTLKSNDVNTRFIQRLSGVDTGRVNVDVNESGQPHYDIQADVAWDRLAWSQELGKFAKRCDAVCFGTLGQRSSTSKNTILKFLESTRRDCLRVFDVNLRQSYFDQSLILKSLEMANVLKLNDEELPVVGDLLGVSSQELDVVLPQLADQFGLELIALTAGSKGSTLYSRGEFARFEPTESISVCDTVGAGDAFTATTVFGFLRRWSLDRINHFANQTAAFVCTQAGATPDLPEKLLESIHLCGTNDDSNSLSTGSLSNHLSHREEKHPAAETRN